MATKPTLRVLHTSDWHLGHTLHDRPRELEHERFLDWLLGVLEEQEVDALLVAGDVFHTSNPPASAQRSWYAFLGRLRQRRPKTTVVVTAGNHDSASRLEAPAAILRGMDVHVLGGLPRHPDDSLDLDRLVLPLRGGDGRTRGWVAAVPFLRPVDLRPEPEDPDPVTPATHRVYEVALEAARARCQSGEALLAMGHCYMAGGQVSELSERSIQVGNQHALPGDLFPEWVAYAALGHLHRPQRVGDRHSVRYSGSPVPLSMDEAGYEQQVCVVDFEEDRVAEIRHVPVPRSVDLWRVPRTGAIPSTGVLQALLDLPDRGDSDEALRPLLEVQVLLDRPNPDLPRLVEEALASRLPRLVKLAVSYAGKGGSLAEAAPRRSLQDLQPTEVFRRCYQRGHDADPPDELLHAFHRLLESVQQEEA